MVVPPTPLVTTLRNDLRAEMRRRRLAFTRGLPAPERERLERALAVHIGPLVSGRAIGSYAAVGAEIDPRFIEPLAAAVLFPRVTPMGLTFHLATYDELVPGPLNILQPRADAPERRPDVILAPLLAADLKGNRLGQGGGYYDKTLAALRREGPVMVIGLAWEVQIVPKLSAEAWDQPLDWIATPERLVGCRPSR